jgi:phosphatidylserine/phosphatidylglycerophosphate/cardiolipin synthase-like enzyme
MRATWQRWHPTALVVAVALALGTFFYQTGRGDEMERPSPADDGVLRVYFTPQAGQTRSEDAGGVQADLVAALESASSSIDIAVYDLDLPAVRDALIAAHRRGLRVRVVAETDNLDQPALQDLLAAGVPLVDDRRPSLMHHKFVVIDEQQVWTGSLNLTWNGLHRNDNHLLAIQSTDLAADYLREFEEMFIDDRFGPLSLPDTPYPFLAIGEAAVEVGFSPDDGIEGRLLQRLQDAESQILVLAFVLTSDSIAEALLQAHERGVEVRAVAEARQSGGAGSDVDRLRAAGLDLRLDTNPANMHHKVIVIDRSTVIVGSYNFTQSAEHDNDENSLMIDDPGLAAQFVDQFELIYQAAVP